MWAKKQQEKDGLAPKQKKTLSGKEWLSALIPAAFLSFTFCIFGPVEIYIANISELWFSIDSILWTSIIVGAVSCGVFTLIGILLPDAFKKWYSCILIGLGVALYIQGNFIQTNYGVLDGREIDWDAYGSVAIWDTAIWVICLLLPFAAQKFLKEKFKSISSFVLCCVLLVQVITLGALAVTTDWSKSGGGKSAYLSKKNLYTVSSEKNVVVFVLDTFDEKYLEDVLAAQPDILDSWDGFTSYTNATCAYPTTKGSLPFMLTGQYYKNEQPYNDYIEEAYQNTDFFNALHEAGYDINVYTHNEFVSDDAMRTLVGNAETDKISVNSYTGLEKAMLRFTAFRYFPHIMKQFVWFYSGVFDQYIDSEDGDPPYSMDNVAFYTGLKTNGLQTVSDKKSYHFIHLLGTHPPFTLNEDVTTDESGKATSTTQGIACLNIVSEYISELKKLDLYDDTMIIVTADHGATFQSGQWPIYLEKGFDCRGSVSSSSAPVSHENLIPAVMDACGLNDGDRYGKAASKISESDAVARKYYYYDWDNSWDKDYLPVITEYMVDAKRRKIETGNRFTSQGIETFVPLEYHLGEDIVFTNDENGDGTRYFISGISYIETDFVWSSGTSGQMVLNMGKTPGDLIGEFRLKAGWGVKSPPQRLVIKCGGLTLFDEKISSTEDEIRFAIPENCIKDGWLTLDLEYPDAVLVEEPGEDENGRKLAFAFESIRFYSEEEEQRERLAYDLGSSIVFTSSYNGTKYFTSGISYIETDFAWSSGTSGQMVLSVGENPGALMGEFRLKAGWGVKSPPQRLVIKCGGLTLFDEKISSTEDEIRFAIPENCIKDGWLTLDLEYPDAASSADGGGDGDARKLAFAFESIRFYKPER